MIERVCTPFSYYTSEEAHVSREKIAQVIEETELQPRA